jgi:hypothetical protein
MALKNNHGRSIIPFPNQNFAFLATWMVAITIVIMAIPTFFSLLGLILKEIGYLTGFQNMTGARVIDPPRVAPPGREVVAEQMAHGRAGPADVYDVSSTYAGQKAGGSDQRFPD